MTVYLLHFERKIAHAGHYLGSAEDLERRIEQHRKARRRDGRHHELVAVMRERGIGFEVVRTWRGGRKKERQLKDLKRAPDLCPICTGLTEEELRAREKKNGWGSKKRPRPGKPKQPAPYDDDALEEVPF